MPLPKNHLDVASGGGRRIPDPQRGMKKSRLKEGPGEPECKGMDKASSLILSRRVLPRKKEVFLTGKPAIPEQGKRKKRMG